LGLERLEDRKLLSNLSSYNLDFHTDGVLPSSAGWTYVGNEPETTVFSVSNDVLHLDTIGLSSDANAVYELPEGDYKSSDDLFVQFEMKAVELGSGPSFGFAVNDRLGPGAGLFGVYLQHDSFYFLSDASTLAYTFNPFDGYHTYTIVSKGGSLTYQFYVDGNLVKTDRFGPPFRESYSIAFGDGSSGPQYNSRVDIDYIHFNQ